jgi:hypothetical protein
VAVLYPGHAGRAVDQDGLGAPGPAGELRYVPGSAQLSGGAEPDGGLVGVHGDVGIQHRQQRGEFTAPGRGQERLDQAGLAERSPIAGRILPLDAAAGPAGQLASGLRGTAHDRGDVGEGHGEHVVEHERDTFGRREPVQDHEQGEPDGVGQQGLVLRVGASRGAGCRVGSGAGLVGV